MKQDQMSIYAIESALRYCQVFLIPTGLELLYIKQISFKGCLLQGYDKLTHPQLNCKFIPYQYETIFLLSFEYFLEERFPLIELKMAYFHEVTIMILLWSYFDLDSILGAPSTKF